MRFISGQQYPYVPNFNVSIVRSAFRTLHNFSTSTLHRQLNNTSSDLCYQWRVVEYYILICISKPNHLIINYNTSMYRPGQPLHFIDWQQKRLALLIWWHSEMISDVVITQLDGLFNLGRQQANSLSHMQLIKDLLFTDDAALAAHTQRALQRITSCFAESSQVFGHEVCL